MYNKLNLSLDVTPSLLYILQKLKHLTLKRTALSNAVCMGMGNYPITTTVSPELQTIKAPSLYIGNVLYANDIIILISQLIFGKTDAIFE